MNHRGPGSRCHRSRLVGGLVLAGLALTVLTGVPTAWAQPAETTTSAPAPTTTAAPPTTAARTTVPTTAAPTTARPATTVPTTAAMTPMPTLVLPTTTITPAATGADTWFTVLLIVLAVLAVGAAVAAIVGLVRGHRSSKESWQGEVRNALVDVDLTVGLVTTHTETPDPRPFSQVITPRLQLLRGRLETVAAQAPSDRLRQEVGAVASGVQSFGFAAEAEWMLRKGAVPPSADQLTQAGAASFERRAALERSMTALRADIGDQPVPAGTYP